MSRDQHTEQSAWRDDIVMPVAEHRTLAEAARAVAAWPYHGMAAQQPGYLDFQAALDNLKGLLDA